MKSGWFTLAVMIAGVGYGLLAAKMNQNPYYSGYGRPPSYDLKVSGWRPSPLWLPSYLAGRGDMLTQTGWGYTFPTPNHKGAYYAASALTGFVMATWAYSLISVAWRFLKRRRKGDAAQAGGA